MTCESPTTLLHEFTNVLQIFFFFEKSHFTSYRGKAKRPMVVAKQKLVKNSFGMCLIKVR